MEETTLLRVVRLKGDVCSAEIEAPTPRDYDRIGAAILSLMDRDGEFAKRILSDAALYVMHRNAVGKTNEAAMRSAEIKLKN